MKDLSREKLCNWAKLIIRQDFPLMVRNNTQLDDGKSNIHDGCHFLNERRLFLDVSDTVDSAYSPHVSHMPMRVNSRQGTEISFLMSR
jgi:hypothetical protein